MPRPVLAAVVLLLACAGPAAAAGSPRPKPLTVVQANVGNINGACADARFKLCQPAVEARAKTALRRIRPDVAGFEELLPPGRTQATRLLGKGYAISCDRRYGWDCVAVRKASGVRLARPLSSLPVVRDCDDGFTVNTGRVRYAGRTIAFGLAHPNSSSTEPACRADELAAFFKRLPARGSALVLGDFNLDPYREDDASTAIFDRARKRLGLRLASGRPFTALPGSSMLDPTGEQLDSGPQTIGPPFGRRTLDLVLTRRIRGHCRVRRVDGGGGMDHRAQVCTLRPR